jgi:DNA polymerase III beta subunit, N-terminal domain
MRSATDLELSIRTSCEAKVKKEGAGTVPAKKLLELVRLLPDEEIRFANVVLAIKLASRGRWEAWVRRSDDGHLEIGVC